MPSLLCSSRFLPSLISRYSTSSSISHLPLLPSVQHLLALHKVSPSDLPKISPTGPLNRVLKSDVLAYLSIIPSDYPTQEKSRIEKLQRINLTNIKHAKPTSSNPPSKNSQPVKLKKQIHRISLSLSHLINCQLKVFDVFHVKIPLSTLINRAVLKANKLSSQERYSIPPNQFADLFDFILSSQSHSNRFHSSPFNPSFSLPSSIPKTNTLSPSDIYDYLITPSTSTPPIIHNCHAAFLEAIESFSKIDSVSFNSSHSTSVVEVTLTTPPSESPIALEFLNHLKSVVETDASSLVFNV